MLLKSLKLKGFKSFADRTILKFEPGVTAIIGPNGSGKSNITDAILWVMGEQSTRLLRATSMEDVIFNGSEEREPVSLAEVALTLDNSDGKIPLAFTEVTVLRRMTRSGESEYFLNGSPCRLLDIQEILFDSGIGRGFYSVIGQGGIEEVLNSKPEERRFLIDEAAGVLKYKRRKERALRRFEMVDQSLARARDVLREIDRQLRPLKKQAEQAKCYFKLAKRVRDIEVQLAVTKLRKLQKRWEENITATQTLTRSEKDLKEQLARLKEEAGEVEENLKVSNQEISKHVELRQKLAGISARLNAVGLVLEEKESNWQEQFEKLKRKIGKVERRRQVLEGEIKQLRGECEAIEKHKKEISLKLAELVKEAEIIQRKKEGGKEELATVERLISQKTIELDQSRGNWQRKKAIRETSEEVIKQQCLEKKSLVKKISKINHSLIKKQEEREVVVAKLTELTELVAEKERRVTENGKKLERLKEEAAKLRQQIKIYEAGSSRINLLLQRELGEVGGEAQGFLTKIAEKNLGRISELIEVEPGFEAAIEAVLGYDANCHILQNFDIEKILALRREEETRISILALESAKPRYLPLWQKQTKAVPAVEVVRYPKWLHEVIQALLGRVLIVSDLTQAFKLRECLCEADFVTKKGDLLLANGKIVLSANRCGYSFFSLKAEQRELKQKLEKAKQELAVVEEREKDLERAVKVEKTDLAGLESEYKRQKTKLFEIEKATEALELRRENLSSRLKELEVKIADLAREKVLAGKEIEELQMAISILVGDLDKLKKEKTRLDAETQSKEGSLARISTEIARCQVAFDSYEQQRVTLYKRLEQLVEEIKNLEEEDRSERKLSKRLSLLISFCSLLEPWIKSLSELIIKISEQIDYRESQVQKRYAEMQDLLVEKQNMLANLRNNSRNLAEEKQKLAISKARLEVEVNNIVRHIVEELKMPLEKALAQTPTTETEVSEEELEVLRNKLEAMGPINAIAVEEYEKEAERRNFFAQQIEDLIKSKKIMQKVIRLVEKKIEQRFRETFENVNKNFQEIFATLFPGGYAELSLISSKNGKEQGIEIIAQPMGKRLQKMSLLSGGEKALTALAFLFALYKTRPTPFCVLDEVEVALDDINLSRFLKLIEEYRSKTQFIIITHQRRTMEMADVLYGVSMGKDGVSKLVSQKFSELDMVSV
jgi:chromosome segregation protein